MLEVFGDALDRCLHSTKTEETSPYTDDEFEEESTESTRVVDLTNPLHPLYSSDDGFYISVRNGRVNFSVLPSTSQSEHTSTFISAALWELLVCLPLDRWNEASEMDIPPIVSSLTPFDTKGAVLRSRWNRLHSFKLLSPPCRNWRIEALKCLVIRRRDHPEMSLRLQQIPVTTSTMMDADDMVDVKIFTEIGDIDSALPPSEFREYKRKVKSDAHELTEATRRAARELLRDPKRLRR